MATVLYADGKQIFPNEEMQTVPIPIEQYAHLILSMQKLNDIRKITDAFMDDDDKVSAINAIVET